MSPAMETACSILAFRSVKDLPPEVIRLMEADASGCPEFSADWFANLENTVFRNDPHLRYYVAFRGASPCAVLPVRLALNRRVRSVEALGNYYTSLYAPVLAPGAGKADLVPLLQAANRDHGTAHVMRFAPMDNSAPAYAAMLSAVATIGWRPFRFFCFGNWYLNIDRTWREYRDARPGQLRNNIRRKGRKFSAEGGAMSIVVDTGQLGPAIEEFIGVYSHSWKKPEPYPDFIPGLIRWLADAGWLRLGIARLDGKPIAAQLWIVRDGRASIFKLAHDRRYDDVGAGTLLTARLMEHVIDHDRVREVDYLIGDDPYKREWMSARRERWGIVAYNSSTLIGTAMQLREVTGRATRTIARHLRIIGHRRQQVMNWTFIPVQRFPEHSAQWDALLACGIQLPFLESHFLQPLLAEFGKGDELIAFAEQNGQVKAAAILTRTRLGTWQTFQPSQLPLGAWIRHPRATVDDLAASLVSALPGVNLSVSLTQLDPMLNPRPLDDAGVKCMDYIETAWVDIDQPFKNYWESRGKNLKSNTRKQHSKLQSDGTTATLDCLREPGQVAAAIAAYGELESAGWKGRDGTAVHLDNAQGRFYRTMLESFCALGRGRIYRYSFNDRVVAMDLCIEAHDKIVILKTAYDESYKSISPSTLMRHEEFCQLFSEPHLKRIEFYGKVMEWHTRWTDNKRTLYHATKYRWQAIQKLHELYAGLRDRRAKSAIPTD